MSFDRPWALIALVIVPLAAYGWHLLERRRQAQGVRFASAVLLPDLVQRVPGRVRAIPAALLLLGLCALVVGMAKPRASITVPRRDGLVVLAMDVSRSMDAKDVHPTRLAAAVQAATRFLDELPTRYTVGLVVFGSTAFVAVPPTADRTLVKHDLAQLRTADGTAIGNALELAADLGRQQKAAEGVVPPTTVLLLSDGAPDGGNVTPYAAARRAKELGVPISTVLVGTENGIVTAQLAGGFTEQIKVPARPTILQEIAQVSGGTFYQAHSAQSLAGVYRRLATRMGHKAEDRQLTDAFAGGAGLLVLAGSALSFLLFRRVFP